MNYWYEKGRDLHPNLLKAMSAILDDHQKGAMHWKFVGFGLDPYPNT